MKKIPSELKETNNLINLRYRDPDEIEEYNDDIDTAALELSEAIYRLKPLTHIPLINELISGLELIKRKLESGVDC